MQSLLKNWNSKCVSLNMYLPEKKLESVIRFHIAEGTMWKMKSLKSPQDSFAVPKPDLQGEQITGKMSCTTQCGGLLKYRGKYSKYVSMFGRGESGASGHLLVKGEENCSTEMFPFWQCSYFAKEKSSLWPVGPNRRRQSNTRRESQKGKKHPALHLTIFFCN